MDVSLYNKRAMLRSLGGGQIKKIHKHGGGQFQSFKNNNKTQYDWFPGKSQNSKKFSAKFKQNPTSKNHRVFLGGLKYPQTVTTKFGCKITSKINSAPSNYSESKFSAKSNDI